MLGFANYPPSLICLRSVVSMNTCCILHFSDASYISLFCGYRQAAVGSNLTLQPAPIPSKVAAWLTKLCY